MSIDLEGQGSTQGIRVSLTNASMGLCWSSVAGCGFAHVALPHSL
jgi:hypothetical protein